MKEHSKRCPTTTTCKRSWICNKKYSSKHLLQGKSCLIRIGSPGEATIRKMSWWSLRIHRCLAGSRMRSMIIVSPFLRSIQKKIFSERKSFTARKSPPNLLTLEQMLSFRIWKIMEKPSIASLKSWRFKILSPSQRTTAEELIQRYQVRRKQVDKRCSLRYSQAINETLNSKIWRGRYKILVALGFSPKIRQMSLEKLICSIPGGEKIRIHQGRIRNSTLNMMFCLGRGNSASKHENVLK